MKTIKEFADEIGMTVGALSNIVNGKRRPSWKMAKKIAKATNTDIVLWLEGDPAEIQSAISYTPRRSRFKHGIEKI